MDRLLPGLVELGGGLGVKVQTYSLRAGRNPRYRTCRWPWNGYYVTVDGLVAPCCTRPHLKSAWIAGDIRQNLDVRMAWTDKEWERFREALATREGDQVPEMCRECVEYDY